MNRVLAADTGGVFCLESWTVICRLTLLLGAVIVFWLLTGSPAYASEDIGG